MDALTESHNGYITHHLELGTSRPNYLNEERECCRDLENMLGGRQVTCAVWLNLSDTGHAAQSCFPVVEASASLGKEAALRAPGLWLSPDTTGAALWALHKVYEQPDRRSD